MLTILFDHGSFFFLIIDLHFLISAVTAQIFNPIAELVIPTKEEILDMETHPAIAEPTIRKCSIQFRVAQTFCAFY